MTLTPARPTVSPAADTWPGLDTAPSGARNVVAAPVARALFTAAVKRLDVTVHIGDGGPALGRGGPEMTVHRPDETFARIGRDGLIGFGEAYLTGAWDSEDLAGFLTVLAARIATLVPEPLQKARKLVSLRAPSKHHPTEDNSQDNIAHHYDLSNELFALFLDPTMSYSSGLFEPGLRAPLDLAEAQARKIERLLDSTGVTAGSRVLEIGTGWGELAIRAARRGARVTSITLSVEQQELARDRVAAAGYSDQVSVELRDYRTLGLSTSPDQQAEEYDAVLSVEMIEAVGAEFWPSYFTTIDRVLAPAGRVGIQAITMPHDRMLATRGSYTWINKYIFPGGFLPSVEAIEEVTRTHTSLRVTDRLSFGQHYAETLRQWDNSFMEAVEEVHALGFDETFVRMWHFYLEYSRAGFASGYLDVAQLILTRPEEQV